MVTFKSFDWAVTNKDLVLLVPNFGRGRYIRKVLDSLTKTTIPTHKWIILVANDGVHEDFSDLEERNVVYFTFERSPSPSRSGAFMRNIVIKHGECKMLAQKDPEVFYTSDFIKGCFDHQGVLYRCGWHALEAKREDTENYLNGHDNLNLMLRQCAVTPIVEDIFVFWHYGHCAPLESFKKLGGYDEDYKGYGYEDTDMHDRLMKSGLGQYFDRNCIPVHLWHEKPKVHTDETDKKRYEEMGVLYNKKRGTGIIRNVGVEWGNGDPGCSQE